MLAEILQRLVGTVYGNSKTAFGFDLCTVGSLLCGLNVLPVRLRMKPATLFSILHDCLIFYTTYWPLARAVSGWLAYVPVATDLIRAKLNCPAGEHEHQDERVANGGYRRFRVGA
jgi:hypothetical protein